VRGSRCSICEPPAAIPPGSDEFGLSEIRGYRRCLTPRLPELRSLPGSKDIRHWESGGCRRCLSPRLPELRSLPGSKDVRHWESGGVGVALPPRLPMLPSLREGNRGTPRPACRPRRDASRSRRDHSTSSRGASAATSPDPHLPKNPTDPGGIAARHAPPSTPVRTAVPRSRRDRIAISRSRRDHSPGSRGASAATSPDPYLPKKPTDPGGIAA
jgi:hypothetical protein